MSDTLKETQDKADCSTIFFYFEERSSERIEKVFEIHIYIYTQSSQWSSEMNDEDDRIGLLGV